ncbi:MAG: hypothetical protein A2583_01675 [Bdellovibrionales bacterium RIFOXYD1_FULL_53_11]|nr:MAG: hypothetical protein A2583_01675 [Bdellovibrionales bacterium RIFOXYD1_FULL_53_11]
MSDHDSRLQELLGSRLGEAGYDVVELVEIPGRTDRMMRIRTVEEILNEFEADSLDGSIGYIVRIRPKTPALEEEDAQTAEFTSQQKPRLDGIYLPNGKLNLHFLFKNAELLFRSGEFQLASNILETILKSGERSDLAHFWLGKCSEAEGDTKKAMEHYEESIAYRPGLDAYRSLSAIQISCGKNLRAAELLESALNIKELGPAQRREIHLASGNCWLRSERLDKAEKHYKSALALDPSSDLLHANIGALHLQAGRLGEARKSFHDALAINPANDKALAGIGSCFLAEGGKSQALDFFARALDINISNPAVLFQLVSCAFDTRNYSTAARIVDEYIQRHPVNANLLYSLASLQYHMGRMNEAARTARRVLEMQPQHAGAQEILTLTGMYVAPPA